MAATAKRVCKIYKEMDIFIEKTAWLTTYWVNAPR